MKYIRRWKNEWLKEIAFRKGLQEGVAILVRERSILKDGGYITRKKRYGTVLCRYPYHFYCQMEDGTKESFRYNEFLGDESRLVRLKGSPEENMSDQLLNQLENAREGVFLCEAVLDFKTGTASFCLRGRGKRFLFFRRFRDILNPLENDSLELRGIKR